MKDRSAFKANPVGLNEYGPRTNLAKIGPQEEFRLVFWGVQLNKDK